MVPTVQRTNNYVCSERKEEEAWFLLCNEQTIMFDLCRYLVTNVIDVESSPAF